jgi:hypothetical protein
MIWVRIIFGYEKSQIGREKNIIFYSQEARQVINRSYLLQRFNHYNNYISVTTVMITITTVEKMKKFELLVITKL